MSGIYGSHAEDRYFEAMLHKHLYSQDALSERIDAMADDLYRAKLAALPTMRKATDSTSFSCLYDSLNEFPSGAELTALAIAVRDNNIEAAGKEFIRLVTKQLRDEAQMDAEESC